MQSQQTCDGTCECEDAIQARGAELDALNRMYQRDLSDQFVAEEQAAGEDLPPVRLHPDFEETGLVAGLSGLLARFQKTVAIELAVDVDLQQRDRGGRDSFPERFKSGVYRIIEEALDNVVKHSGARSAHVNLGYQADGKLSLSVLDEGRGFHGSGGPVRVRAARPPRICILTWRRLRDREHPRPWHASPRGPSRPCVGLTSPVRVVAATVGAYGRTPLRPYAPTSLSVKPGRSKLPGTWHGATLCPIVPARRRPRRRV